MIPSACKILAQSSKNAGKSLVSFRSKHTLPDLPYDYNALEPVVSADIRKLHHTKHHQAYVNNLNIAEEQLKEAIGKSTLYYPPTPLFLYSLNNFARII